MKKFYQNYIEFIKKRSPWGTPWYGGGDQFAGKLTEERRAWQLKQRKKFLIFLLVFFILIVIVIFLATLIH